MDTPLTATQIIILTSIIDAIISGLVGGIVIYVIQKRIENSFAQKLEQFKAQLQYSNFELQTRFTETFGKRVKALEILYQKLLDFQSIYFDTYMSIQFPEFPPKKVMATREGDKNDKFFLANCLDGLWTCYDENRLFLTSEALQETSDIFVKVVWLTELMSQSIWLINSPSLGASKINEAIKISELNIPEINIEEPNRDKFLDELIHAMIVQVERMEKLYKSVADVK
jgi:hypothetical protein